MFKSKSVFFFSEFIFFFSEKIFAKLDSGIMNIEDILDYRQKQRYYSELCTMISPERVALFEKVVEERTDMQCVVLENIYQSQNASAVLRTCDCLGLQQVHIIENDNLYRINPDVALGSSRWLDLHRYNRKADNTSDCLASLKAKGYMIVATLPHEKNVFLNDLDVTRKLAVVFGNELNGLSEAAIEAADIYMKIPMYGFTESFNISVSAAITMQNLGTRLRESGADYRLSPQRKLDTLIKWAKRSIKRSDLVEKELMKRLFDL